MAKKCILVFHGFKSNIVGDKCAILLRLWCLAVVKVASSWLGNSSDLNLIKSSESDERATVRAACPARRKSFSRCGGTLHLLAFNHLDLEKKEKNTWNHIEL